MTLPSSKGTEGTIIYQGTVRSPSAGSDSDNAWLWTPSPLSKPLIFGTATSNGIAVKNMSAVTGGTVNVYIEFITTSYL